MLYLVLPLRRHDLGIGTGNGNTGVETSSVVSLDNVAPYDLVGADPAVVGPLGPGEPISGPAKGPSVEVQESVFLLDAEPGVLLLDLLHSLVGSGAFVRLGRRHVGEICVAKDQNIIVAPEGVFVDRLGLEVDVAVTALGLIRRTSVILPLW